MKKFTNCFLRNIFFSIALLFIAWNGQAQTKAPVALVGSSTTESVAFYKLNFIHWASQQSDLSALTQMEINFYNKGDFENLFQFQIKKGNVVFNTPETPVKLLPAVTDMGAKMPLVTITTDPAHDAAVYKSQLTKWVNENPTGYYNTSSEFKLNYAKAKTTGDFSNLINSQKQNGLVSTPKSGSSMVANQTIASKPVSKTANVSTVQGSNLGALPVVTIYDDKATTINTYKKVVLQWKSQNPDAFNLQEDKVKDYINNGNFDLLVNMQYLANNFITLK